MDSLQRFSYLNNGNINIFLYFQLSNRGIKCEKQSDSNYAAAVIYLTNIVSFYRKLKTQLHI